MKRWICILPILLMSCLCTSYISEAAQEQINQKASLTSTNSIMNIIKYQPDSYIHITVSDNKNTTLAESSYSAKLVYSHSMYSAVPKQPSYNQLILATKLGEVVNNSESISIAAQEDWTGKTLAWIVYMIALIVLLYFLYWLSKQIHRLIQPSFVEIPAIRQRISSLKSKALQYQEQAFPFLKSTQGESNSIARQAYDELQRLIQQIDDITLSVALTKYSVFQREQVKRIVRETTATLDQIEQDILLYTSHIQKINEAKIYVSDQLHDLKDSLQRARRRLQQLQAQTGFSLQQVDTALFQVHEHMETIKALQRYEPLQAAASMKQVMTTMQGLALDLSYVQQYSEKCNQFAAHAQHSKQLAESLIEQHQLRISYNVADRIAESTNHIPELQQAIERGDMIAAKSLYKQMEQRIEQIVLHIQQLIEKKQQIQYELPLLDDKISFLAKAIDQREQQWNAIKERYPMDIWNEQYQKFIHTQQELQQSTQHINKMKQLIHPDRQAYEEADHLLTTMKRMIKQAENVLRANDDDFHRWKEAEKPVYETFNECVYQYERINKIIKQSEMEWGNHAALYRKYEQITKQQQLLKNTFQQSVLHIYRLQEQLATHKNSLKAFYSDIQRLIEQRGRMRAYAGSLASEHKQAMYAARTFMKSSQIKSYEQEYQLYIERYVELMQRGNYDIADEPLQNIRQINERLHSIVQTGKIAQQQRKDHARQVRLIEQAHRRSGSTSQSKKSSLIDDDD
ncbi:septation ring formation regulator EzrA [Paenibacillus hunanensis]|uniref:septation ring formation regulator EzrA n=1 Tax=Paenibacillus hunanensis TaxID=539262 RepID=UPI002A6AF663|nr:septation ring formation regulator EzrA [Paenibacillus hunanensis]WPP42994.1 septation ring formation regulator EzrA [Paenibacillus hunanensis]